jgi:hypothetical protein
MFPSLGQRFAGNAASALDRAVEFATLGEYCVEWELEPPVRAPEPGQTADRCAERTRRRPTAGRDWPARPGSSPAPKRSRGGAARQPEQPCLAVQAGLIPA